MWFLFGPPLLITHNAMLLCSSGFVLVLRQGFKFAILLPQPYKRQEFLRYNTQPCATTPNRVLRHPTSDCNIFLNAKAHAMKHLYLYKR